MTATVQLNGSWTPIGSTALPAMIARPLAASAQVGKGQFVTVAPATGYASLNDGATPNQISAGIGDITELSDTSSVAGAASARLSERWFYGLAASAVSLDGFTDADFGVPFYIASENTLGKLSNSSGSNRTLGGLVYGLAVDGTPNAWAGPIAWQLARSALATNAADGGTYAKAVDAGAATDLAEALVSRPKLHGRLVAVEFQVTGTTLAASGATNYKTITISKRDGAGGAAVVVATVDTQVTAFTQWTAVTFTLSAVAGAIDLLETDLLTIQESHAGTGAIIPAGTLRAVLKVQ